MFKYASITTKGSEVLAQAVAGRTLVFTRMEYGSGILDGLKTITSEAQIKQLFLGVTALVSKKADIGMYSQKVSGNTATLTGKIVNSSISEDFNARELGVFAKIDGGTEVLFAYFTAVDYLSGTANDTSDFISADALMGQEHKVVVNVATGNAANITIEYNPEVFATKEEFDALVAQNTADHEAIQDLIDEKIGSIDISASLTDVYNTINNETAERQSADINLQGALASKKSYDFVVDSNETLLEWANCTDGSMKSVLVKSGEYTLNGKMINLSNAGTKFVFAEPGNKITVSNYNRGIGATEKYGAVVIGLNIYFSSYDETDRVAFYRGMSCYNCTAAGIDYNGYGFYQCTCYDCTGDKAGIINFSAFYKCTCINCTGIGLGYGFYSCTCINCTGEGKQDVSGGRNSSTAGFYQCTCSNCEGSGCGYGFDNCICSNCVGYSGGNGNGTRGYGFYQCTCSNCKGAGRGSTGYAFYSCSYCSSCRNDPDTASTTATWGGTNTYIDSDSCDYVAA